MEKLKNCPCCGGETILCRIDTGLAMCMEFSILCLGCGMEFKVRKHPMSNACQYIANPEKAAMEVIELFNRRVLSD